MASRHHSTTLAQMPLFAACTDRERRQIAALFDETALPAGTVLVTEGELGDQAFILIDGTADVSTSGGYVATLGAGDLVGEMALLDRSQPRSATVTARTDVTAFVVDPRSFEQLLTRYPRVSRQIAAALARRLRAAS